MFVNLPKNPAKLWLWRDNARTINVGELWVHYFQWDTGIWGVVAQYFDDAHYGACDTFDNERGAKIIATTIAYSTNPQASAAELLGEFQEIN